MAYLSPGSSISTTPLKRRLTPRLSTLSLPSPNIWISTGLYTEDFVSQNPVKVSSSALVSPQFARLHRQPSSPHTNISECGKAIRVNEVDIALFKIYDTFFATQLNCSHMGANLTEGGRLLIDDIEDCAIECPLHKLRFALRTGKSLSGSPGVDKLKVFPVRFNEEGLIEIGFDELVLSSADF